MFPARKALAIGLLSTTLLVSASVAQTMQPDAKLTGLWLTTDFPALTQSIGEEIAFDIRMENRNLPPQQIGLGIKGLPEGWNWSFKGAGTSVTAATVRPDQATDLKLELFPPKDAKAGTYAFTVTGDSGQQKYEVPVSLTLSAAAQAKATLEPKLPALRGTPKSNFEFELTAKNDSRDDQVFNLLAQVPPGFEAVFKEQYGGNELTSIPVKAGQSTSVKLAITMPERIAAGQYPVKAAVASPAANANVDLLLDITGRPDLNLTAKEGRLSGDAIAGRERSFTYVVQNTGTSPMEAVSLSASPPTGWKVSFSPEKIDSLKPGDMIDVAVNMTPASNAIAGDYMVNIRANGENVSDTSDFRVTVKTSTVWGAAGLGIIAASLAAFGVAVNRYGRR